VQVIDDQDEGVAGLLELGQYLVHHGATARAGRHRRQLRTAFACRGPDRAQHGEPEQLHIALARPYGHEGDTAIATRLVRPPAQQRRLPGAGRRRDNRDPLLGRQVQGSHQVMTADQPRLCPALYHDGMVRIVVTPNWAKLIDFETTLPTAVEELIRQQQERQHG
jgi:hypothetical protein